MHCYILLAVDLTVLLGVSLDYGLGVFSLLLFQSSIQCKPICSLADEINENSFMCRTFDDESVWSSHCSRKDLTTFREVTSDSKSNCPRSFIPVDAFLSSSAKVFNSIKVFFHRDRLGEGAAVLAGLGHHITMESGQSSLVSDGFCVL